MGAAGLNLAAVEWSSHHTVIRSFGDGAHRAGLLPERGCAGILIMLYHLVSPLRRPRLLPRPGVGAGEVERTAVGPWTARGVSVVDAA
jgi:hypothetical protein